MGEKRDFPLYSNFKNTMRYTALFCQGSDRSYCQYSLHLDWPNDTWN